MGSRRARRPLRALFIDDSLRDDGARRVAWDLACRWAREGVETRFLVLDRADGDAPVLETTGGPPVLVLHDPDDPAPAGGLLRAVRAGDVVVVGHETCTMLPAAWWAARLTRRRLVVLVQSDLDAAIASRRGGAMRRALRSVHARVDLAACTAPGLHDGLVANGLAAERITTIPFGVDVEAVIARGRAEPPGPGLPPPDGDPLVVAVGRLRARKGFDHLVRAAALLRDRGCALRVLIIGEGGERTALERLIHDLRLADRVHLTGHLPDPQPWIARADLFVLPSRFEGHGGLAVMEALAQQVPVIATDCPGGPRFLLRQGVLGDLVRPGDPGALADAVQSFLQDPERLRRAARGGPDRVRAFEPAVAAQELRAQLELLRRGRRSQRLGRRQNLGQGLLRIPEQQ